MDRARNSWKTIVHFQCVLYGRRIKGGKFEKLDRRDLILELVDTFYSFREIVVPFIIISNFLFLWFLKIYILYIFVVF